MSITNYPYNYNNDKNIKWKQFVKPNMETRIVDGLDLSQIMNLFTAGNLTVQEAMQKLASLECAKIYSTVDGNKTSINFVYNGENMTITSDKDAIVSSSDEVVETYSIQQLRDLYNFDDETIYKFFDVVEVIDDENILFALKKDGDYSSIAQLYQDLSARANSGVQSSECKTRQSTNLDNPEQMYTDIRVLINDFNAYDVELPVFLEYLEKLDAKNIIKKTDSNREGAIFMFNNILYEVSRDITNESFAEGCIGTYNNSNIDINNDNYYNYYYSYIYDPETGKPVGISEAFVDNEENEWWGEHNQSNVDFDSFVYINGVKFYVTPDFDPEKASDYVSLESVNIDSLIKNFLEGNLKYENFKEGLSAQGATNVKHELIHNDAGYLHKVKVTFEYNGKNYSYTVGYDTQEQQLDSADSNSFVITDEELACYRALGFDDEMLKDFILEIGTDTSGRTLYGTGINDYIRNWYSSNQNWLCYDTSFRTPEFLAQFTPEELELLEQLPIDLFLEEKLRILYAYLSQEEFELVLRYCGYSKTDNAIVDNSTYRVYYDQGLLTTGLLRCGFGEEHNFYQYTLKEFLENYQYSSGFNANSGTEMIPQRATYESNTPEVEINNSTDAKSQIEDLVNDAIQKYQENPIPENDPFMPNGTFNNILESYPLEDALRFLEEFSKTFSGIEYLVTYGNDGASYEIYVKTDNVSISYSVNTGSSGNEVDEFSIVGGSRASMDFLISKDSTAYPDNLLKLTNESGISLKDMLDKSYLYNLDDFFKLLDSNGVKYTYSESSAGSYILLKIESDGMECNITLVKNQLGEVQGYYNDERQFYDSFSDPSGSVKTALGSLVDFIYSGEVIDINKPMQLIYIQAIYDAVGVNENDSINEKIAKIEQFLMDKFGTLAVTLASDNPNDYDLYDYLTQNINPKTGNTYLKSNEFYKTEELNDLINAYNEENTRFIKAKEILILQNFLNYDVYGNNSRDFALDKLPNGETISKANYTEFLNILNLSDEDLNNLRDKVLEKLLQIAPYIPDGDNACEISQRHWLHSVISAIGGDVKDASIGRVSHAEIGNQRSGYIMFNLNGKQYTLDLIPPSANRKILTKEEYENLLKTYNVDDEILKKYIVQAVSVRTEGQEDFDILMYAFSAVKNPETFTYEEFLGLLEETYGLRGTSESKERPADFEDDEDVVNTNSGVDTSEGKTLRDKFDEVFTGGLCSEGSAALYKLKDEAMSLIIEKYGYPISFAEFLVETIIKSSQFEYQEPWNEIMEERNYLTYWKMPEFKDTFIDLVENLDFLTNFEYAATNMIIPDRGNTYSLDTPEAMLSNMCIWLKEKYNISNDAVRTIAINVLKSLREPLYESLNHNRIDFRYYNVYDSNNKGMFFDEIYELLEAEVAKYVPTEKMQPTNSINLNELFGGKEELTAKDLVPPNRLIYSNDFGCRKLYDIICEISNMLGTEGLEILTAAYRAFIYEINKNLGLGDLNGTITTETVNRLNKQANPIEFLEDIINSTSFRATLERLSKNDTYGEIIAISGNVQIPEVNNKTESNYYSKISNPYYEGDSYYVENNSDILTITNIDKGGTVEIDLNILMERMPEAIKEKSIQYLLTLPAEVLIDMWYEAEYVFGTLNPRNSGEYSGDVIYLDSFISCVHELGHAIDDFEGASYSQSQEFQDAFQKGMERYRADGLLERTEKYAQYELPYLTYNATEFFAECYEMLMTGEVDDTISIYFPECIDLVKKRIEYVRNSNAEQRSNVNRNSASNPSESIPTVTGNELESLEISADSNEQPPAIIINAEEYTNKREKTANAIGLIEVPKGSLRFKHSSNMNITYFWNPILNKFEIYENNVDKKDTAFEDAIILAQLMGLNFTSDYPYICEKDGVYYHYDKNLKTFVEF